MLGRKSFTRDEVDSARRRMVTGKDTNPLNEVELLVDSLRTNGGVLEAGRLPGRRTVVAFTP
jgi:hypothetical protein